MSPSAFPCLFSWMTRSGRRAPGRKNDRRNFRFRPWLESLEDRIVPDAVSWINPAGGAWETASNWSTGTLPGPTDDAVIDLPDTFTVTHSFGTTSIHRLLSDKALVLSGGSFALAAASSTHNSFIFTGGTLTGGGDLTIDGLMTWSGGTMSGTGSTTIAAMSALHINGSGPKTLDSRTLNNAGAATWSNDTRFFFQNGGAFNNLAGALFDNQNDGTLGSVGAFVNAGAFRKSAGSGTTLVSCPFNHGGGTVDVETGTVVLNGGGSSTGGTFLVAGGRSLILGGSFTYTGAYDGSGAGTVQLNGTLTIGADGAAFNFPANLFQWVGGSITGATLSNTGFIALAGASAKTLSGRYIERGRPVLFIWRTRITAQAFLSAHWARGDRARRML
jgi:hypothetical protein